MYVTGVMSSVSITSPSSSQASSTWSIAAMSAIEQPAARSGRTTGTRSPPRSASFSGRLARMSAVSAMKWTPQKAIAPAIAALGRHLAEVVAVAAQVGERDHFVLLIVMPQDQQLAARARRGPPGSATSAPRSPATCRAAARRRATVLGVWSAWSIERFMDGSAAAPIAVARSRQLYENAGACERTADPASGRLAD